MEGNRHPGIAETTDRQFFALLRSGLWNEVPERAPFDGGVDWEALYRLSFAQTVGPLVTDGVNRLPKEYLPAEPEHLDPFLGDMMATAQRNRVLDSFIPKVFHALRGIPGRFAGNAGLSEHELCVVQRDRIIVDCQHVQFL